MDAMDMSTQVLQEFPSIINLDATLPLAVQYLRNCWCGFQESDRSPYISHRVYEYLDEINMKERTTMHDFEYVCAKTGHHGAVYINHLIHLILNRACLGRK